MTKDQHNLGKILELRDEFRRRDTHVVAVVIARGNSRRLPRKNLVPICGRPLMEWSIIQGLSSHLVNEVYLSTDDEEIAEVGRKAGAHIIWRYDLSDDVTGNIVFAHAIRQIRETQPIDAIVCILPTNPLRHPWDIDESTWLFWECRRKDRWIHELIWLIRQPEVVYHKEVGEHKSQVVIGDKAWNYLDASGTACNIADPDWYLKYAATAPSTDSEINVAFVDVFRQNAAFMGRDFFYYYAVEPYQRFDLDYPDQVGLIEDVMKRYILTEPDIYAKYKASGLAIKKESITI